MEPVTFEAPACRGCEGVPAELCFHGDLVYPFGLCCPSPPRAPHHGHSEKCSLALPMSGPQVGVPVTVSLEALHPLGSGT